MEIRDKEEEKRKGQEKEGRRYSNFLVIVMLMALPLTRGPVKMTDSGKSSRL